MKHLETLWITICEISGNSAFDKAERLNYISLLPDSTNNEILVLEILFLNATDLLSQNF